LGVELGNEVSKNNVQADSVLSVRGLCHECGPLCHSGEMTEEANILPLSRASFTPNLLMSKVVYPHFQPCGRWTSSDHEHDVC